MLLVTKKPTLWHPHGHLCNNIAHRTCWQVPAVAFSWLLSSCFSVTVLLGLCVSPPHLLSLSHPVILLQNRPRVCVGRWVLSAVSQTLPVPLWVFITVLLQTICTTLVLASSVSWVQKYIRHLMSRSFVFVSVMAFCITALLPEPFAFTQLWVKLWSAFCLSALAIPWKHLHCGMSYCGETEHVSLARAVRSKNYAWIHEETQRDTCVLEQIYKLDMLMSVGLLIIKENASGQRNLNTLETQKYQGSLVQSDLLSKGFVAAE